VQFQEGGLSEPVMMRQAVEQGLWHD
jgi:hypothetical protein